MARKPAAFLGAIRQHGSGCARVVTAGASGTVGIVISSSGPNPGAISAISRARMRLMARGREVGFRFLGSARDVGSAGRRGSRLS